MKQRRNPNLLGTGHCAAFNLRRTSRAVTSLYDDALRPAGISSPALTILAAIAEYEPISVGDLADVLVLDPTTMTRNLQLLRRKGLLAVSIRSSLRQRFVTLLAKGRKALARSLPLWRRVQRKLVGKIGRSSWRACHKELERISILAVKLRLELKEDRP